MSLGETHQFCQALHGAVIVDEFAKRTDRFQAGQAAEIDGRFRVAGANQYAARLILQRENVTRTHEVGRIRVRVRQCIQRTCSLEGGYASGHSWEVVC